MKNIVIVDAEIDADYDFGGYLYLRQLLPAEGFHISFPLIDRRTNVDSRFDLAAATPGIVTSTRPGGVWKPAASSM